MIVAAALLALNAAAAAAQTATPSPTPTPCPAVPSAVPDAFGYQLGLGDVQFSRARYSAAVLQYTCALELRPNDATALAKRGFAYAAIGESESALADYEAALAADELYVTAYIHRAALYTQLGNFGLALNDLTLALSLTPDNPIALNNRAVVHAIEGSYTLALEDLEAAMAIAPDLPILYITRAAVYSALAARDYQRVQAATGNAPLPAGRPTEVLSGIDEGLRTGDFGIWLALLSPDAEAGS
jgi:tetratricopeptide (TPR) repeat protein